MRTKRRLLSVSSLSVAIVGIGVCFLLYTQIMARASIAAAHQEEDVVYPTQYSDTHITENAKATDPRFKALAAFDKKDFLASVISSLGADAPSPGEARPPE